MSPEAWNLLNEAQSVINKLTPAQRRAMAKDDSGWHPDHRGKISSPTVTTARKLHGLGLIQWPHTLTTPTPLGEKVRDLLRGRDGK